MAAEEVLPDLMWAAVTVGSGGLDKLEFKQVERPRPKDGEVLLLVLSAGLNNTDINCRLSWYSASVTDATNDLTSAEAKEDGGWDKPTPWPLIQGTDCCGRVVGAGAGVSAERRAELIGRRVLVRCCQRTNAAGGGASMDTVWFASDYDGAFAQYVVVPAGEVFPVSDACGWSDIELGSIPCAYGTSENMLHRARVEAGMSVLVTGASGGVGSATVQLAKRRGARVIAVCGRAKADAVRELGADQVLVRGEHELVATLGAESIDVAVDNVAGSGFADVLAVLRRGGKYVSSGAIGGPVVQLDMRTMYLHDLTLIGSTAWDEGVFENLISYIERGEIKPLVARTFPLSEIAAAQTEFLKKEHVGKFVLVPP